MCLAMTSDDLTMTRTGGEPRLAFSPDEVAAALGISREQMHG